MTRKTDLTESIKVSPYVKQLLEDIKCEEGHTSMDSVIRTLLLVRVALIRLFPKGFMNLKEAKQNG
ncbi:MAG: hypothetical protein PHU69_07610 [Fermentimonas sp.]|nr:hypothetical protein [Fermentimonas sp.]